MSVQPCCAGVTLGEGHYARTIPHTEGVGYTPSLGWHEPFEVEIHDECGHPTDQHDRRAEDGECFDCN